MRFFPGISDRHCLLLENTSTGSELTPPHDISGKGIRDHLPKGEHAELLLSLMKRSREILKDHPVNKDRIARGLNPATSVWFWGEGRKPSLKNFEEKNGVKGSMISAVDLLKGIAMVSGMDVIEVEGATGNNDTNYKGKALAALRALETKDFVYIHIEAADECGHRGQLEAKIKSIEDIDEYVVGTLVEGLKGEEYSIMILPDHPTPIALRTHTSTPVPYMIYRSNKEVDGADSYTERNAEKSKIFIEKGYTLMDRFLEK
jgi:2,3-bisphosphoglycerate-independent phosphoglycerate mutase